jgi:hypothetical protein
MRQRRLTDECQPAFGKVAQAQSGRRQLVQSDEAALDLFQPSVRAHGGPQSTAFAVKQRQTERALQARQLATDRGLRTTQLLGCTRDLAGGHDGTEHFNLAVA